MNRYIKFINYINSIISLPDTELHKLKELFTYKKIKKSQAILRAGDPQKNIAFCLNGVFRYYYSDCEGNEKTKYFVSENNFLLSLSSFIEDIPSLYSIEAVEDGEILVASVNAVKDLIEEDTTWLRIYKHILERSYLFKEEREAEFLLYNAKMRYLRFVEEYPGLYSKVKKHQLASYLGITPESLSRIHAQVKKS